MAFECFSFLEARNGRNGDNGSHFGQFLLKSIHDVTLDCTGKKWQKLLWKLKSCQFCTPSQSLRQVGIDWQFWKVTIFWDKLPPITSNVGKVRWRGDSDVVWQPDKYFIWSTLRPWHVPRSSIHHCSWMVPLYECIHGEVYDRRSEDADVWDSLSSCRKQRKPQRGSDAVGIIALMIHKRC